MLKGERKKRWLCVVVVIFCSSGLAKGGTDLIETTFDDPDWVLVTSDVILREDICTLDWYEKVFNPCYPELNLNRYWKLEECAKEGRAFTMGQISEPNWLDSIYVREGFEFQLYYNAEEPNDPNDLLPAGPRMAGPQYVTLTYWRDTAPPPEGFEPETFFVSGEEGDLAEYSIIIYTPKCQIVNNSFEDPGWINNIAVKEPNGWDVNMPTGKFKGYVHSEWPTDGSYNLTLYSEWFVAFNANDKATVSQQVDLTDIDKIIFDLKLATGGYTAWDPNKVSAVVLIDNDAVWESNSVGSDVRGEYFDQTYIVDGKYRDGMHTLSFGIRVNVTTSGLWERYITHWDFIECTFGCGEESLPEDFSGDGCVNFIDFAMLAGYWLEQNPPSQYDLAENGIVDANDLGAFVDKWLDCSNQQE